MKLSPASAASLHEALQKIAVQYSGEEDQLISTDFYFMPSKDGGLLVFNDDEEEIYKTEIPEWCEYTPESFYDEVAADLSEAINGANTEGELERLAVWMPYSFVLVDEERESVCDLLLVDDDALLVKNGLLEGLDEELNQFIKELLND